VRQSVCVGLRKREKVREIVLMCACVRERNGKRVRESKKIESVSELGSVRECLSVREGNKAIHCIVYMCV